MNHWWEDLWRYNSLLVLLGTSLLGAAAGLVGTFALLRRKALLGDAFAHATLPGLCLAFLLVGERRFDWMLVGAFLSGIAGLLTFASIRRLTLIKEDAALGIVLSVFFGLGIVLSHAIQKASATGSKAGLESYLLGKTAGMVAADVESILVLAALLLAAVASLYKELRLVSFDPDFAHSQGWPVASLNLLLLGLVGVAVVVGLPSVGVVMIAAVLILPAACARFWTERLTRMLILASLFGAAMGVIGTVLSTQVEYLPTGPVIVLVGSLFFVLSALFAPRRGMLARWRASRVGMVPPLENRE